MNCQSFEHIVTDLAREQLIAAALREEGLQHTSACPACAARLTEERSLTASLRALALEMNSVGAPEAIAGVLLTAFNEQQLSRQARPGRWNYLPTAAAAVLLVALGIGVAAWNLRTPLKPAVQDVVASAPHIDATVPVLTGSQETTPAPPGKPAAVANPKVRSQNVKPRLRNAQPATAQSERAASLSEIEVATDFMPIGYVNSASLQDGGSVVRVELPRSTIVSMGFAVNMDRYGERVKADVLMGADGFARAIRLVQ
jgi:hypothetical protein